MKRWLIAAAVLVLIAGALTTYAAAGNGKLNVATPGMVVEIEVRGRVAPVPPNREVPLPAGDYKVKSIKLHAKGVDTKGRPTIWRIEGTKVLGKLATVKVTDGQTTTVEGGEPITVKTPVGISKKGAVKTVSVGLQYLGKAGESYRPVVYRGRSLVPAPKLQIVGESGKPVTTASFEYG